VQNNNGVYANGYYVYDVHGSVRALTDATGAVTDTYDYDAFGNLIHSTGTTPNNYLFTSEQFDTDLGLYFNRARYLNTSTGSGVWIQKKGTTPIPFPCTNISTQRLTLSTVSIRVVTTISRK
jgi:RHS repeat-associated protein